MPAKSCAGKQRYPHLFEPIRIGNIKLKNRIIAAPTSPRRSFIPQPAAPTTNSSSWILSA